MDYTTNLNLKKPAYSDPADVAVLNGNMDVIDESVAEIEGDLYNKSDNLFDFSAVISNKIPNLAIGASIDSLVDFNGYKTSNRIPVEGGARYYVIRNGGVTLLGFIVAYYSNGILVQKDNLASNPFTVPSGADTIIIITSEATLFTADMTSVKKYSPSMDYVWRPYGHSSRKYALVDVAKEYGVYVDNGKYYHFVKFGNTHIIRMFRREGPNNLFQFSELYLGSVTENGVSISETIAQNRTDIVGPISILRQEIDSGGKFAGGYHDVGVDGTRYPTAKQDSLVVKVNGIDITSDNGIHYGEVNVYAANSLYFPQTIIGSDLSVAVKSIVENRHYTLNDKMNVSVRLDFVADTRVICYYGLQAVRIGFNDIYLPNDEIMIDLNSMSADYLIEKPNRKVIMTSNNLEYEITLSDHGLGDFSHNSNSATYKYGSLPANTRKYYQQLIAGDYDHTFIANGKSLYWEGCYDIHFKQ